MELTALVAAVAAFGLPCSNPELRDCTIGELPWPAAYIRSIEGDNVIALRRHPAEPLHCHNQVAEKLSSTNEQISCNKHL